jgi:predicted CoA-binding protein
MPERKEQESLACPMPTDPARHESEAIARMLASRRIAVVGLSDDPARPSHYVSEYLADHGYDIIPVNPNVENVLGRPSLKSLADLNAPVDVVLVFRRAEHCPEIARQAASLKARGLWLQSGIVSDDAKRIAQTAGMKFVQNRCMMVEHRRRPRDAESAFPPGTTGIT